MLKNFMSKKMMGKMGEMQQKMEVVKDKLSSITLIGEAAEGKVQVIANGNRLIHKITIADDFLKNNDISKIEEAVKIASNRALEQAERVEKSEMSYVAMSMMPD